MAILVNCGGCGRQFRAKDQFRNTKLKCPGCRADVLVQGPHVCGTDVFVSHSSHDKQVADAVCAALESKNLRCWVAPRDIPPGASWGSAIIEGIEDSRSMLLVFSGNANRSDQVLREVERAVAKRKPVVPLRIDNEPMRKDFEYFLASCHWLDVTDGGLESHLSGLTRRMRHLLLDRAQVEADAKPGAAESKAPDAPAAVPATGEEPATRQAPPAASRRKWGALGAAAILALVAGAVIFAVARQGASESGQNAGEANPTATQPAPAAGSTQPGGGAAADSVDLLAKFRVPRDVVSGEWTRTADGVHVAGPAPGRANFGEPPAGDYDLEIEFTPLIGDDAVLVVLSRFGKTFAFAMGAKKPPAYGFGFHQGSKRVRFQQVTDVGPLANDVRHVAVIQVRRHGATATVDGQQAAKMFTATYGELSLPKQFAVGRNSLGLITFRTATVHAVRVTPVSEGSDPAVP